MSETMINNLLIQTPAIQLLVIQTPGFPRMMSEKYLVFEYN